ncbi:MAG: aconitate hydratase, partial [Peptococcaceae bacterium]|nr:aconitate hydratase [Peptococcaceae bacterium]
SVPERATITNMGAELGATTSIFPSDEITRAFLASMGREDAYQPLSADADAKYMKTIHVNLGELVPMAACPHSPDNVVPVSQLAGESIHQVAIGSCTNSSYLDLAKCAMLLKGKKVNENVSLVISPGSRRILKRLADDGLLSVFLEAGARVLECGCGPCIGMGQAPCSNGKSLRTFNRNFYGRSGTKSADVYLVSPETAIASAIAGVITDPIGIETFGEAAGPEKFEIDDNLLIAPNEAYIGKTTLVKGPNIKGVPTAVPPQNAFSAKVLTVLEDNITTDHIMPSNASLLPYRSNIPHLADYCLTPSDAEFPAKAKVNGGGIIVAGENYGQGSSREHAALAPLYLGVKAVVAKSFARIHKQNLVNNGIIPLTFADAADYDQIHEGDELIFSDLVEQIKSGNVQMQNKTTGAEIALKIELGERQEALLLAGGLLTSIKNEK